MPTTRSTKTSDRPPRPDGGLIRARRDTTIRAEVTMTKGKRGTWFLAGWVCGALSILALFAAVPGVFLTMMLLDTTTPSQDAYEFALQSDLQTVRSQIELYRVQHLERLPGVRTDGTFDGDLFLAQMTERTDIHGNAGGTDADLSRSAYGPYLQRFPRNDFADWAVSRRVSGGKGPCPGDGTSGWYLNTETGAFSPNDPDHKD